MTPVSFLPFFCKSSRFAILALRALILCGIFCAANSRAVPVVILNSPTNETFRAWPASINLAASADEFDFEVTLETVTFLANGIPIVTLTNDPIASPFDASYDWTNAMPGMHEISALARSSDGSSNISYSVSVLVYTNTGTLTVSVSPSPANVDLSSEGAADWAHWGAYWPASFDRRTGVVPQISNFSYTQDQFENPVYQLTNGNVAFTWTNGAPTPAATNSASEIYTFDNGFDFTVAAGDTMRTLKIYAGAYSISPRLRLYLTDGSVEPVYYTLTVHPPNPTNVVFNVNVQGVSTNATLVARYELDGMPNYVGYISLQSAALATGNLPPQIAITNIANQSVFQSPTNLLIATTVGDSDGSVTNVSFFDGATKIGSVSSAPWQFTWTNAPAGLHKLTARATDDAGAIFDSPTVEVSVITGGGMIAGGFDAAPSSADLTLLGRTDWAHWGLDFSTNENRRALVTPHITRDVIGTNSPQRFTDYPAAFSWTNGTPTEMISGSTAGVFVYGLGNGFQVTAPADSLLRRLQLYISAYAAIGRIEATLSDASAAAFLDHSLSNVFGSSYAVYTLDYASASAGQTLTVKFTSDAVFDTEYGNATLEAATVSMLDRTLRNPQKSGTTFQVSVPTDDAQLYSLQFSSVLPPTNWDTLTTFLGNGALTNVTDISATNSQRFYRVTSE